jgi:CO/xanthine dehydrogenase Mo-binding subunit
VQNALGVPVRETPITANRIWELIRSRSENARD